MERQYDGHRFNVPSARALRARQTRAESVLWDALRNRGMAGLKFRRQHPIGPFVVDFCCAERRLVVEVDGGVHETQVDRDEERAALLEAAGYRVLRFPNEAVSANLAAVLAAIEKAALECAVTITGERSRTSGW